MNPQFRPEDDLPGLTVVDPLERSRFTVETSQSVELRSSPVEEFSASVGVVTSLTTARFRFPFISGGYVRNATGTLVLAIDHETSTTLPASEYYIELTTPVKTYLHLDSAVGIDTSDDRLTLSFDGAVRVEVGARSHHTRPAGTVTTTEDPVDVMAAVSAFGSALKTTSPERSFPTLRGHPPTIEFGDELQVPDELRPPETGVRIELPPDFEHIFPATPLAYYLGATLVPGNTPRIVTSGTTRSLDGPRGFEGEVERVLKQTFLFDCVTRTEGLYRVDLHERTQLESKVDLDFPTLYDAPLAERLRAYLSVPFSTVADVLPTWRLAVHVTNEPSNVTQLPYVLRNLPLVRTASSIRETDETVATATEIREFARAVGSDANSQEERTLNENFVSLPAVETLEHAWLGTGTPVGGNKLLRSGFENRLARERSTADIEVTFVCNDEKMQAEWDDTLYGNRDDLSFDVTTRQRCTTAELRTLLSERTDFFHYIGHVEDGAFVCPNGLLDPNDLASVGANTFLLNACRSYTPGKLLVDGGSIGGIVTYSDVGNASATTIGQTIARLLSGGFPLRAALSVARSHRLVGNQYVVVGDGSVGIAQAGGGVSKMSFVEPLDDGEYSLRIRSYPTNDYSVGSNIMPFVDGLQMYYLAGGDVPSLTVSETQLRRFFELENMPVVYDGDLCWSSEITLPRDLS
ncbi:hypothetical protein [Haladaptatus sp. NG-WS-4]